MQFILFCTSSANATKRRTHSDTRAQANKNVSIPCPARIKWYNTLPYLYLRNEIHFYHIRHPSSLEHTHAEQHIRNAYSQMTFQNVCCLGRDVAGIVFVSSPPPRREPQTLNLNYFNYGFITFYNNPFFVGEHVKPEIIHTHTNSEFS